MPPRHRLFHKGAFHRLLRQCQYPVCQAIRTGCHLRVIISNLLPEREMHPNRRGRQRKGWYLQKCCLCRWSKAERGKLLIVACLLFYKSIVHGQLSMVIHIVNKWCAISMDDGLSPMDFQNAKFVKFCFILRSNIKGCFFLKKAVVFAVNSKQPVFNNNIV